MINEIKSTDSGKNWIETGKRGQINAMYIPDFAYTTLGKFIIFRLRENRDVKIVITGKGKTTGTGKTTLAILLARFVNWVRNQLFNMDRNWNAKDYSFVNVWEYLEKYSESEPGDALITDELEYMADRRRHQTKTNVKFSQAWSVLRYRQVVTIGTAPGLSDLEKRIPEGTDIWLNVVHKGKANTYYLTVDDFTWENIYRRLRLGKAKESILWNPIENDPNYQYLKEKKEDIGVPGIDDQKESDSYDQSDLNKTEKEIKKTILKNTLKELHERDLMKSFSQERIGDMCEVSQPQVSKVKREMEKEGILA